MYVIYMKMIIKRCQIHLQCIVYSLYTVDLLAHVLISFIYYSSKLEQEYWLTIDYYLKHNHVSLLIDYLLFSVML